MAKPLLEAVDVLRSDATARPTGFLRPNSKWSRLLRTQSDHRLWETAVLFHLRDAFRAGDVWLARSRRYGDIRKALLSVPAVADADRSLPVPASPHDWLAERRFALDEGLRRLAAAARAGAIAGGSIEDSVLRVERTEAAREGLERAPAGTGGSHARARAAARRARRGALGGGRCGAWRNWPRISPAYSSWKEWSTSHESPARRLRPLLAVDPACPVSPVGVRVGFAHRETTAVWCRPWRSSVSSR